MDEKSDFGIINPDGTPRPAAEMITRYRPRLQAPRGPVEPGAWFTFDRDAHAGGYWWAAFHEGAEAYARAHASGKLLGVARRALAPTRRRLRCWLSAIAPTTAITRPSTSTPSSTSCRYSRGTATGRTCVTEQPSRCLPTLRSEFVPASEHPGSHLADFGTLGTRPGRFICPRPLGRAFRSGNRLQPTRPISPMPTWASPIAPRRQRPGTGGLPDDCGGQGMVR